MTGLTVMFKNVVWDIIGAGFAGCAMYGFVTGKITGADLTAVTGLAALYLGIKVPTSAP